MSAFLRTSEPVSIYRTMADHRRGVNREIGVAKFPALSLLAAIVLTRLTGAAAEDVPPRGPKSTVASQAECEAFPRLQQTALMLGSPISVVVEEYELPDRRDRQIIESEWTFSLPAQVDPASVWLVDDTARPISSELRWPARPGQEASFRFIDFAEEPKTSVEIQVPPHQSQVTVRLASPPNTKFRLIYQTDRLRWRAEYEAVLRGDIANYLEPLSVDFEGRLFISNGLDRAFSNPILWARSSSFREARRKPLGILVLEPDNPLSALWLPRAPEPIPPYLYRMPTPLTIPANREISSRFAAARRAPAERIFRMRSEDLPLVDADLFRPLVQAIAIRNDRRAGLGVPLPAGRVQLSGSSGRISFRQEAVLEHTPQDARILLELGPADGIVGLRRTRGRTPGAAGFPEETIELIIQNRAPSGARVEIVEKPPVPLAWDLVRSSKTCRLSDRRLWFEVNVPAGATERITYTVRVTEPAE